MRAGALYAALSCWLTLGTGCAEGLPSSFDGCSSAAPCASAQEDCYATRACDSVPDEMGRIGCGPELGDLQCHRQCSREEGCADGEACREVIFYRGDSLDIRSLCFRE